MREHRDLVARADRILAIAGLVLLVPTAGVLSFFGRLTSFARNPCGQPGVICDLSLLTTGGVLAHYVPLGVAFVALVATIAGLRAGRRSWWMPLLGVALAYSSFVVGFDLTDRAVTGPTRR